MSAVPQSLSSTFNAVNKPVFVLAGGFIAVFCGLALILISIGSDGISKLQSFIVVTAVPVSLVLLPSLWDAFRIVRKLNADQQA